MKNRKTGIAFVAGMVFAVRAMGAAAEPVTVLLVPPSRTLVRFAGDVHDCFPGQIEVAVYTRRGPLALRVVQVWNARQQRWLTLSPQQWRQGEGLRPGRKRLLVITPPGALERDVLQGLRWTQVMQHIEEQDLGTVANRVDALFGFSTAQWRWLAQAHGLLIEDRHAERRRYGRFGPRSRSAEAPGIRRPDEEPDWVPPRTLTPWTEEPAVGEPVRPPPVPPPGPEKGVAPLEPAAPSAPAPAKGAGTLEPVPSPTPPARPEKGVTRPRLDAIGEMDLNMPPVEAPPPATAPAPVVPPPELDAILTAPPPSPAHPPEQK